MPHDESDPDSRSHGHGSVSDLRAHRLRVADETTE